MMDRDHDHTLRLLTRSPGALGRWFKADLLARPK
jgi:hypothetical protein